MTSKKVAAAVLVAAGLSAGAPAQAETFALGVLSSSQTRDVFNDGLSGWFADAYTFTVAEGSSVNLYGSFSNAFGAGVTGASNLWSDLYVGSGQFVRFAVGSTEAVDGSASTFQKTATYDGVRLGAGSYGLFVQGRVVPAAGAGTTGSYAGQVRFDVTSPVPEPSSLALMVAGVLGLGAAVGRRRSRG